MKFSKWKILGQGNNGIVVAYTPEIVVKYTVDPIEVGSWLSALAGQEFNKGKPLPGMPEIFDVQLGDRYAVILREDAKPLAKCEKLATPRIITSFHRSNWLQVAGRLSGTQALMTIGRYNNKWLAGLRDLAPLQWASAYWERNAFGTPDVRPANIAQTVRGLINVDPGRSPLESLLIGQGEFQKSCPNEKNLVNMVKRALHRAPSYKSCNIVGDKALRTAMHKHGWKDEDIDGTAGFHTADHTILIRPGSEWSILHELFHAAGIVDRSLGSAIIEGITEACAQDAAKQNGIKHRPTYPAEVKTVRLLAATLGKTPLDLGRQVVDAPEKVGHTLSSEIGYTLGLSPARIYQIIGPGNTTTTKLFTALTDYRYATTAKAIL